MNRGQNLRLHAFVTTVVVAAIAACIASWHFAPMTLAWSPLLLALAASIAEAMAVELPSGPTVSVATPLVVAVLLLYGPTAGVLVAVLCGVMPSLFGDRRPLLKQVFNIAELVLTATLAGWVFYLLNGMTTFSDTSIDSPGQIALMLVPVLLLSATMYVVNSVLVSSAVGLSQGQRVRDVLMDTYYWMGPTQLALGFMGLLLAVTIHSLGYLGLILFTVPLVVSRQIYQSYVSLRETYSDTVRSLVAAIEAKDHYTRGHSERVASYAVRVGRRMGLPEHRMRNLEYAALLHDVGKIGVSKSILLKDCSLTDEEMTEVRRHPETGAYIVESIPFLDQAIPAIRHHHERCDGLGYCGQLCADDIPLEARILAVADSFDAMTSERPYRRSMSYAEAVEELREKSGSQFDVAAAHALVEELLGAELASDSCASSAAPRPADREAS